MIDFNISNKYSNSAIIIDKESYVLQQIDLLFNTDIYSVLGDENYGTNYDDYLYTTGMTNYALESIITNDIMKLDLQGYSPQVTVYITEGTERDIAFINVDLYGENTSVTRTYVIN